MIGWKVIGRFFRWKNVKGNEKLKNLNFHQKCTSTLITMRIKYFQKKVKKLYKAIHFAEIKMHLFYARNCILMSQKRGKKRKWFVIRNEAEKFSRKRGSARLLVEFVEETWWWRKGEKRIISDAGRSEKKDEGVKAEWYVRGAGMRGEYFTRKIQLRAEDSQDT